MSIRLAVAGSLLVLLVSLFGDAGAQSCNPWHCRCEIRRDCPSIASDPVTHFDLMDDEFARIIRGQRAGRNPDVFCRNRCLNLLKSYLCTPYDFSIRDRPDGVILDLANLIGHHRICQGVPESAMNCVFTLRHGTNCGTSSINIGTTGCLAIDVNMGAAPTIIFNFADEGNSGSTPSYLGGTLDLTMLVTEMITIGN
ncbi:hypothetical protein HOLleu_30569 [Holothuria leucospilota]|uniref:Uncharacterized protein n=1 Tax=Holothuria leucospilota TaxID=206669 RepID=A0A9Q1BKL4_HOLLE|nr:hypothetical protein HOLleu_30569 [Holothuria leucospilota]